MRRIETHDNLDVQSSQEDSLQGKATVKDYNNLS